MGSNHSPGDLILSHFSSRKRTFFGTKHASNLGAHFKFSSCPFKCHVLCKAICSCCICAWHALICQMFLHCQALYRCCHIPFASFTPVSLTQQRSVFCVVYVFWKNSLFIIIFSYLLSFAGTTPHLYTHSDFIYLHNLRFLKTEITMVVHFKFTSINFVKCYVQT